jgi:UDP-4-amino-4,6-dideoxy-N-acetyl-beta-L-altrosamine transaminase
MARRRDADPINRAEGGMSVAFLPYGHQSIDDADIAAVAATLRAEYLTGGPKVEEFEHAFAKATGAPHAVACNSGTAALHLAALSLDLSPDQAAVVPAMTFLATANVVRMTGAEVTFADVDADTGLMTEATFTAAADRYDGGKQLTAAFPVHLNGQVGDMGRLAQAAAPRGITLVEDACHALGVPDVASSSSAAVCFSTHPVKAIATGEGGVVTTRESQRAHRMRRLRSHGMSRDSGSFVNRNLAFDNGTANSWYYEMQEIGWNYRIPDLLCALGISQLTKLNQFAARRREIAVLYDRLLAPLAPNVRPAPHDTSRHGWHLYVILIDFNSIRITRAHLMKALREKGIGTQVHYIPLHHQPYYRARYGDLLLPGADRYYSRCLSIPIFPAMTNDDVHRVVQELSTLVMH